MNIQLLELIFLSEKRKDLLLFLKEGPKTIEEIKMHLEVGSVGILPQLKKLRENFLVIKKGNIYSLSPLGIAVVSTMQSMVDLLRNDENLISSIQLLILSLMFIWGNGIIEPFPK